MSGAFTIDSSTPALTGNLNEQPISVLRITFGRTNIVIIIFNQRKIM
jgi:hypothetical protein